MKRAIITLPPVVRRGEVFEIRTLIAHPMESGHRADAQGQVVPVQIIRRFVCRLDGALIFDATLHPAIAANPFIAFHCRARTDGTLSFTWEGDRGFLHTETVALRLA